MTENEISIPLTPDQSVSAVLSLPDAPRPLAAVVFAHGAANDKNHPMICALAAQFSARGYACLRFNFLYRELGKKSVDPEHRLVLAWQKAMAAVKQETGCSKIIAAGKSLGARIAAQAAAAGQIEPEALVFLGYPLHAPGKKDRLRDGPLHKIRVPMLFFEGTRDPFCDITQFKRVFSALTGPKELVIIENGDHGFGLPKSDPRPMEAVYGEMASSTLSWIETILPQNNS